MPKPPAAFSPLAMVRWMFSAATIPRRWRATKVRPVDAKMSPIKRRLVISGSYKLLEGGSQPPRRTNFRHLTPNLTGWSPPRTFRLLHGGFPPELAHRHVIEPDPMTLTVGSIFGSRSQTRQVSSHLMIPGPQTVTMELWYISERQRGIRAILPLRKLSRRAWGSLWLAIIRRPPGNTKSLWGTQKEDNAAFLGTGSVCATRHAVGAKLCNLDGGRG